MAAVRRLADAGHRLTCWSSGGADYAREVAEELGLGDCFVAYLTKPTVLIDDLVPGQWRGLRTVHPNAVREL